LEKRITSSKRADAKELALYRKAGATPSDAATEVFRYAVFIEFEPLNELNSFRLASVLPGVHA
jgi:hypothetical protein